MLPPTQFQVTVKEQNRLIRWQEDLHNKVIAKYPKQRLLSIGTRVITISTESTRKTRRGTRWNVTDVYVIVGVDKSQRYNGILAHS